MFSKWNSRRAHPVRFGLQKASTEESTGLLTPTTRLDRAKHVFSQCIPSCPLLNQAWKPFLASLVLASLTVVTTLSLTPTRRIPFDTSGYLCAPNGVSPAVAHSRGCAFDWMSFHWLPASRFDAANTALIAEFNAIAPWKRYADAAGKRELTVDEMLSGTSAFLTRREHLHHCQYSVRQAYLFMARGDDPPFDYAHIVHCTDALMEAIYENEPANMDDLVIQAVPFPKHPEVVS